ncbi:hypothetical protein FACS1894190_15750 [Spirochaetia bacterium]|nr:hypothetical protein FACS1894190_15750 [Spirochaetia bacterium]
MRKFFVFAVVTAAVSAMFISCATSSTPFVRSAPFSTTEGSGPEGGVIVRVVDSGYVDFDNSEGDNLRINGVTITTNEFELPITSSYDFRARVRTRNRGIIGYANIITVTSKFNYDFEAGKTYLIEISQTAGSNAGAYFLGAFLPAQFELELFEYVDADLKKTKSLIKFDATNAKKDEEFFE